MDGLKCFLLELKDYKLEISVGRREGPQALTIPKQPLDGNLKIKRQK